MSLADRWTRFKQWVDAQWYDRDVRYSAIVVGLLILLLVILSSCRT